MHRNVKTAVLFSIWLLIICSSNLYAWSWDNKNVVTIDDITYTTDDVKQWWQNYREKDMAFPESPDPFIDWHLLVKEAEFMELDKERSYQHRINVFLKVRALMKLQYDEIDSKAVVSEEDIKKKYKNDYLPLWKARILYFQDAAKAKKIYQQLTAGTLKIAKFKEKKFEDGGPKHFEERLFRPLALKDFQKWYDVISNLKTGEFSEPFQFKDMQVVLQLIDIVDPGQDDFENFKESIKTELIKIRKGEINSNFYAALRMKYNVQVNDEIFAKIGIEQPPEAELDKVLVSTTKKDITVKDFMGLIKQEQVVYKRQYDTPEKIERLKNRILNGMLFQTLTTWESLNRHYEEEPPLKGVFEFYKQHRLIRELEAKVLKKQAVASDAEVKLYYQKHLGEFTPGEIIKYAIWEGEKKNAERIDAEISRGVDFFEATEKYFAHKVPVQTVSLDHLDGVVQQEIAKLVKGGISTPFKKKNRYALMKLIDRDKAAPKKLSEVKEEVAERLEKEKFEKVRVDYLSKLKSRTKIKINKRAWKSLKEEAGV